MEYSSARAHTADLERPQKETVASNEATVQTPLSVKRLPEGHGVCSCSTAETDSLCRFTDITTLNNDALVSFPF